ncbi:MAG: O-antigen ligase domain-containing protein [Bacteroidetes bacterium]|nr:O-antigen ligase domain-containing protein [Bacteroidota bacterium]
MNPFHIPTGAELLRNPFLIGIMLIAAIVLGYAMALGGFITAAVVIAIPILFYSFYRLILKPEIGLTFALIINFFIIGISRYVPLKLGYLMDITLISTYIAMFFHYFDKKLDLRPINNDLTYLALVWFIYVFLEMFNPEALNKTAWFASMRGIGLYMILVIPLVQLLYNQPKHLDRFLKIWAVISIIASAKAWIQLNIGVDPWEQKWLDDFGAVTHILWGNLRAFSFFSDAGQFGAAQGQIGIVAMIMFFYEKRWKQRLFWLVVFIAGYYGMSSSGTRGAIFVPFAGGALYLIIRKNLRVIIIGAIFLIFIYSFFRYTTIGNSSYQIYRMRSAFAMEDDASFQVRLKNQAIFESYLKTRPFGGGIGHAGSRAITYTGETFLSGVATDSWFVLIWAEAGIIGLYLHLLVLGWFTGKGLYISMFQIKNKDLEVKTAALLCGVFGILVASYGNAVLGQFPTGLLVYTSMAYVFMAPSLDKQLSDTTDKIQTQIS